jgi:hypothetical protein
MEQWIIPSPTWKSHIAFTVSIWHRTHPASALEHWEEISALTTPYPVKPETRPLPFIWNMGIIAFQGSLYPGE